MTRATGVESSHPSVVLRTEAISASASAHPRNRKIRPSKSRGRSCVPRTRAKSKRDLQQPRSCCTAKKKEYRHRIRVSNPGGCFRDTTIPSASPNIIFTPDALIPSGLKSYATEKCLNDRYSLDVSPDVRSAAPGFGLHGPLLELARRHWSVHRSIRPS